MGKTIKMGQSVLWVQEDGPGTSFKPFAVGEDGASMTGKTIPVVGVTPVYGRDRFNNPIVVDITETAPGDLPSATITIYEKKTLTFLENMVQKRCPINMQLRNVECGTLDDPFIWDKMTHWGVGVLTTYNPGDGPAIEFDNTIMQAAGTVSFRHALFLSQVQLSKLTTAETADLHAIDGIPDEDCNRCGTGYPGADQVMVIGAAAITVTIANILITSNGGGVWTVVSALPFIADEHVDFVQIRPFGRGGARIIASTTVAGAGKAQYAFADIVWGDETTTVWTLAVIDGTTAADTVEAMAWLIHDRLYFASSGDIYVSVNQGNTTPDAAIFVGTPAINGFAISPDGSAVFAFGASNQLLRELNQNGVFSARVGPTGGTAIEALTMAGDGRLYAGVDGQLWVSTDQGGSAGNWSLLYDFGGTFTVTGIQVVGGARAGGGDSQILRIVVDDPTPGTSQVWQSFDGGVSLEQVTELANDGYNGIYTSETVDNHMVIVGDQDGSTGIIHLLEPVQ